jgi:hypothetical protein
MGELHCSIETNFAARRLQLLEYYSDEQAKPKTSSNSTELKVGLRSVNANS